MGLGRLSKLSRWIACLVFLLPAEARLSGSIDIEIKSEFYQASLESPRMRFVDPDRDAKDWRDRWNAKNMPVMNQVRAILDAQLPHSGPGFELIKYNEELPVVWGGSPPLVPGELRAGQSCLFSFHVGGIRVSFAFKSLPELADRRAFEKQITTLLEPALKKALEE